MSKKKTKPETAPAKGKKPYTTPRLVEYGDLRKIVLASKRSNRSDGAGVPATKR